MREEQIAQGTEVRVRNPVQALIVGAEDIIAKGSNIVPSPSISATGVPAVPTLRSTAHRMRSKSARNATTTVRLAYHTVLPSTR